METDKYLQALNKHKFNITDEQAKSKADAIISNKFDENNNIEVYKKLYTCIDLTSLNSTDSKEHIWQFTKSVNEFEGSNPSINNVASVCVYPNLVHTVKESLTANVKIASVAGGFPSSQTFVEVKVAETSLAIADGADEIDVVINIGQFLDKEYQEMCEELMEIKEVCRDHTLKVILETGALKTVKNIHDASILSMYSGADFIKTSTGKGYTGATPEAVYAMCLAVKAYYKTTSRKVGIKVSGGISVPDDAVKYYSIVKETLGSEWCENNLFRIGTSKLTGILLSEIENKEKLR